MTLLARIDPPPVDRRNPWLRLAALLDPDSLVALHPADDSGFVAVRGTVSGRPVIAYCSDAARMGGAMGRAGCAHVVEAIDLGVREQWPVIGVWHSAGARLGDGVASLDGVGQVFAAMVRASGKVPQVSVVVGAAAGGAAYGPALTDVVIMAPEGRVFVTGPGVVESVTGEQVDMLTLGGPEAHGRRSGVVHVVADSEQDAWDRARRIVGLLSRPGLLDLHAAAADRDLSVHLPERRARAYDVHPLVRDLLDAGPEWEELQPRWAPNVVVGLGRLAGRAVGVVANNPLRKGGCLDSLAAEKAARFVRTCDSFGVPLVVVVDVPGYLPGVQQEWGGVVRRGAKLLHAFAEASVPRVTLVTRKSYGGAFIAMNARCIGATAVYAWPEAEVSVMGPLAAVRVLHSKAIAAEPEQTRSALEDRLAQEHALTAGGLQRALDEGVVDEVIAPEHTRRRLAEALAAAPAGRGEHGNIPL